MSLYKPSAADYSMLALQGFIDAWARDHAGGRCSWATCEVTMTPRFRIATVKCRCGAHADYPETQADRDEDAANDRMLAWVVDAAESAGRRMRDRIAASLLESSS